jgi:hypothetical protein
MNSPAAATPWQAWKRDHGEGAGERATPAAETVHRQDTVARPVFIVGTGRCGSTLVHEVLARHPAFGFISNVDDRLAFLDLAGRWNGRLLRSFLARPGSGARLRFAPSEAYLLIGSRVSPMYVNSSRDLTAADVTPWVRRRFRDFFEARARAQGCTQFLHKYTGWPRLGFFSGIFPEVRFVHVVRDGRAVANSWLQMPWWTGYRGPENWNWGPLPPALEEEWQRGGRSFHLLAAICWKLLMETFEQALPGLPPQNCLVLRYEDFLEAPADAVDRILRFCGLGWTPRFSRDVAGWPVDPGRRNAYERDLTPEQVADIEASLAPVLARYGYS